MNNIIFQIYSLFHLLNRDHGFVYVDMIPCLVEDEVDAVLGRLVATTMGGLRAQLLAFLHFFHLHFFGLQLQLPFSGCNVRCTSEYWIYSKIR